MTLVIKKLDRDSMKFGFGHHKAGKGLVKLYKLTCIKYIYALDIIYTENIHLINIIYTEYTCTYPRHRV